MLTIRYLRIGRRNRAFFRVVLTEKSRPADSGFKKILGWYDPKTKKSSLKKEEILDCINKGAKPSNSVAKLLLDNEIKHKQIIYLKKAKKAPKVKEGTVKKPAAPEKEEQVKPKEGETQEPSDTENKPVETKENSQEPKVEEKKPQEVEKKKEDIKNEEKMGKADLASEKNHSKIKEK